jgi:hypothetical protein
MHVMRILFCSDPLNKNIVDIDYEREYQIAKKLGFQAELISLEDLLYMGDSASAIKKVTKNGDQEIAIYRGWMLTPEMYELLYQALVKKNIFLINSPVEYKHCHYLPESYPVIEKFTPKSTWISKNEIDENFSSIFEKIKIFSNHPIMIKDYVKSRKHDWEEACFIPDASDKEKVEKSVRKFIQLQDTELNEGIVFREFLNLEFLTKHHKSNMPLSKEFRIFFLHHKPMMTFYYWDEGDYGNILPDLTPFLEVAKKINSNFFTMDVAKIENGDWTIIELGDGQVSGLPDHADLESFYEKLK